MNTQSRQHDHSFGNVIRRLANAACFLIALAFVATPCSRVLAAADGGIPEEAKTMTISSPSFSNGGTIAKKFTCDGDDVSPQLSWSDPPEGTKSFALLVDDPDAPVGNWNHWTMWNLPADKRGLPENVSKDANLPDGSAQGRNDFGKTGYNGPCPPPGTPHRYYFRLYALDNTDIPKSPTSKTGKNDVEAEMKGHILAHAELMGKYGR